MPTRTPAALPALLGALLLACLVCALPAASARAHPGLDPDLPSGQRVGTTVTWTATDPEAPLRDHRFRVWHVGEGLSLVHAFDARDQVEWTPLDAGLYVVRVDARDPETGAVDSASRAYWVRAPQQEAAVLPTAHPLVALYSGRIRHGDRRLRRRCRGRRHPCQMRVVFQPADGGEARATGARPVDPHAATTLYVAGLRPETRYTLHHEILDARGRLLVLGPTLAYETGPIDLPLPKAVVRVPRADPATETDPVLLVAPLNDPIDFPYATDLQGRPIWYDPTRDTALLTRPQPGGTFFELVETESGSASDVLREIDLAGHVLRRVTLAEINRQLVERGDQPLEALHHEARRLPDGSIVTLGVVVRELTDVQGPGPVRILGDAVVVLDADLRVKWVWNAFEQLDVTRAGVLGYTCEAGQPGCRGAPPGVVSNDWTHSNAVDYFPRDGNLLLSIRNQDWVVKLDYRDGAGSGDVIWRLGHEGDFAIEGADPGDAFPWFSHAHDPSLLPGGRLAVYDNGNTPCVLGIRCESRGQVYELDERHRTARVVVQAGLAAYSYALGSAQALRGRDAYHFGTGISYLLDLGTMELLQGNTAEEVEPDGSIPHALFQASLAYRSFRMQDLYTPPPSASEAWRLGGPAASAGRWRPSRP